MWRSIVAGLRRLVDPGRASRDLDDEVRDYVARAAESYVTAGHSNDEAERLARLELGGVENVKEQVRSSGWDARAWTIASDIRFAARMLRRNPAFSAIALATIVVGIGATTAMFSVVQAVILRPLPYARPEQLALLWADDPARGIHEGPTAYRTVVDWRTRSRSFRELAIFSGTSVTLADEPRERIIAQFVSGNLFGLLGARPALGRTITVEDQVGRVPIAVISQALWHQRFGGDSSVIGKTVRFVETGKSGLPAVEIVGVMPGSFAFPTKQAQVWVPATLYWRWTREESEYFPASFRRWNVVGRLTEGTSVPVAQREMRAIGAQMDATLPSTVPDFPGFTPRVVGLLDQITGHSLKTTLWLLFGAVGFVLVIACTNVANLLLARGATRQHELATRRALGANRGQLVRQLLTESLFLAVTGGALAVGLAVVITRMIVRTGATYLPRFDEIGVDARVVAFATVVSVLTGVAFGVLPAVRATSVSPSALLKEDSRATGSRRRRRTSGSLVAAECSLAIVLLLGAGLLLRSLERLSHVNRGFNATDVLSVRVALPPMRAATARMPNAEQAVFGEWAAMLGGITSRIAAVPGVQAVAYLDDVLMLGEADASITFPDRPELPTGQLYTSSVSPEAFTVLKVPLRAGRMLSTSDIATKIRALFGPLPNHQLPLSEQARVAPAEPVLVNEAFVRRYYPSESPLGRRFCIDPTGKTYWYEIVGVVGNMRRQGLEREPLPEYFQPALPRSSVELVVRTVGDPLTIASSVRAAIASAMPGAIVLGMTTVDERLGALTLPRRFQTWLLAAFAGLALLLAAVGIYGIVFYTVAERRRELGVRIALGASPGDVLTDVIRRGMKMPFVGVVVGLLASAWLVRLMASLVYDIGTSDPIAIATAIGVLVGVALLACLVPARRAARTDPMVALRGD
jgi:predicted permease